MTSRRNSEGAGGWATWAPVRWWQRRQLRKAAMNTLHHSRHVRAMREDITDPALLAPVAEAERRLAAALTARRWEDCETEVARLSTAMDAIAPPRSWAKAREVVELVAVAGAVAMSIRCYFIQPFRIPTGSMQPTMFGVQVTPQAGRTWRDWPPLSWAAWALFGEGYVETRAAANGYVGYPYPSPDGDHMMLPVAPNPVSGRGGPAGGLGAVHRIRSGLPLRVGVNDFVTTGQVLASGRVKIGDHVFVDKIRYNFLKPRRGDIIVFDVSGIDYPDLRGDFYIKRLAGLPSESIGIRPPHLLVDEQPVESPFPFHRLVHGDGYHGYQLASGPALRRPRLSEPEDRLALGPDDYLPLGDNTRSSLDGRYFGPVKASALVGPAFMIYWPLSLRWGWVR